MTVKELLQAAEYAYIELHDGYDGHLVANVRKTIEKYADTEVLGIYPKIKVRKNSDDIARAYLYVFIPSSAVWKVKEGNK